VRYDRAAVVLLALAVAVLPLPASWVERWYSRAFYPRLQRLVTPVTDLSPVALFDIAIVALCVALVWAAVRWRRQLGWRGMLRPLAVRVVVTASVLYLWFLIFWGMNYRRVPLEEQLAYDPAGISKEHALRFAGTAVEQVNALRPSAATTPAEDAALVPALADVQRRLGSAHAPRAGSPKRSLLALYFRKAAIDGMTDPFFLEVILNPDVLPSERPFVLAHEWAHLAGYADESEANFVAWLTCVRASPAARYSGWLAAYQHVTSGLPAQDRRALAAMLSSAVAADLAAERARFARSNERVRVVARGAYDTYLRANRIDEGIANYNAVVRLMLGVSFDAEWNPHRR
jgi:hypothetical protein